MIDRQATILRAVSRLWERGYGPTFADLERDTGIRNRASLVNHVYCLVGTGLLAHEPRHARTLRLTEKGKEALNVCS